MTALFTTEEILAQLDQCAADFEFPMLDNGYVHLADVRLKPTVTMFGGQSSLR